MLVNTRAADVLRTSGPTGDPSTKIVNMLNETGPEKLRDVATYAEALAENKERDAHLEESSDQNEVEERPDDVPAKATIMIKEINDNRHYWQWREEEEIKSKSKSPVNPDK
nr:hypothetical protein [Halomicroarcula laminariae]